MFDREKDEEYLLRRISYLLRCKWQESLVYSGRHFMAHTTRSHLVGSSPFSLERSIKTSTCNTGYYSLFEAITRLGAVLYGDIVSFVSNYLPLPSFLDTGSCLSSSSSSSSSTLFAERTFAKSSGFLSVTCKLISCLDLSNDARRMYLR